MLNDSVSRSRRITYSITQFKDTDTGRFFYGITPEVSGTDWLFNTMLIGYDREGKKVHEFINSRNFYAPRGGTSMPLRPIGAICTWPNTSLDDSRMVLFTG